MRCLAGSNTNWWSKTQTGQLGNGAWSDFNVPVAVSGGLYFTQISAGWSHTCGVLMSGSAACWGEVGHHHFINARGASMIHEAVVCMCVADVARLTACHNCGSEAGWLSWTMPKGGYDAAFGAVQDGVQVASLATVVGQIPTCPRACLEAW